MESTALPTRHFRSLSLLETVFAYTGKVLAVRPWDSPGLTEIDLHLPGTDMRHWSGSIHIKCKVAAFTYRDYSPAFWDAETFTCTLLVETGHNGPGAKWAGQVQSGDPFHFLKIGPSHQAMSREGRNILLGDATAAGHFAGMRQAAGPAAEVTGAIEWKSQAQSREFSQYFSSLRLDALTGKDMPGSSLRDWMSGFNAIAGDRFFLAGGVKLVSQLRRFLKESGIASRQINAQGFWR